MSAVTVEDLQAELAVMRAANESAKHVIEHLLTRDSEWRQRDKKLGTQIEFLTTAHDLLMEKVNELDVEISGETPEQAVARTVSQLTVVPANNALLEDLAVIETAVLEMNCSCMWDHHEANCPKPRAMAAIDRIRHPIAE